MKIHNLHLRHACHFSDLKIQFNASQPITVILGEQGSGKTTIVKNAFHALSWFSARFKDLRSPGIVMPDQDITLQRVQSKIEIEVQLPAEIRGAIESDDAREVDITLCQWQLYKTLNSSGVGISKVEVTALEQLTSRYFQAIKQDPLQGLPLIAYFPSERFVNEVSLLNKNNPAVFQSATAYEQVPLTFTTFSRFFEWFREVSDIENALTAQVFQQVLQRQQNSNTHPTDETEFSQALRMASHQLHTPSLSALKQALTVVLPELTDIFIEYQPRLQLMVCWQGQHIQFAQLSNSLRNWIALIGDVVRRMCLLNPLSLFPCMEGDGILLIDQIDIDLDEANASTILSRLHQAFPNIQIIATTLHPYVLDADENMQCLKLQQRQLHEIKLEQYQADLQQLYNDLQQEHTINTASEMVMESNTVVEQMFHQFQKLSMQEQQQLRTLLHIDDDRTSQETLL